jgi:formate hydrogenlyase subunit 3/multisubunit Na+/H+ antiporter MnhD subunit
MFAVWQSPAADWSFAALTAAAPSLPPAATAWLLLLALVGFGFKAGCVPFHVWLPPAHAAAPSHVSALMSGIVIKTGIYGLLRVLLMLGGAPAWWALAQHDVKRLLAYHSVENVGIILMGVGIGVLGLAHAAPAVALVGFAAALLHTVNHALFKSLLFLAAGAVYRATGTRNLEALGGLARRMPLTWLAFLVGAAAIVGLPPFNGFVSEWLVFLGLFQVGQTGGGLRLALLGIPALALIGALALACFAKVAGIAFLGTARTARAAGATEEGWVGATPLLLLAAVCVALGVVPPWGIALVSAAARDLSDTGGGAMPAAVGAGAEAIALLALATLALSAVVWWIGAGLARRHGIRRDVTWGCGYDAATPRMQYTASSFAMPLLSMFGRWSGTRVARTATALHTEPTDLVLDGVALPLWAALRRAALRLRPIQQGRLHIYILYVLAALLVLLAYLTLGPRR